MVNRRAAFGLLCCFLLAGPSRGADSFFQDLSKQLAQQGLPATAPINDDTNIAGTAFEFVHLTGSATEDEITLTGLPFKKGWRVQ